MNEYETLLVEAYKGELFGEALFGAIADRETDAARPRSSGRWSASRAIRPHNSDRWSTRPASRSTPTTRRPRGRRASSSGARESTGTGS